MRKNKYNKFEIFPKNYISKYILALLLISCIGCGQRYITNEGAERCMDTETGRFVNTEMCK